MGGAQISLRAPPSVALRDTLYLTWVYGVNSLGAAGNGSYLSYADSVGRPPTPPTFTRILSPTGVIMDPTDATFHGQVSYIKDISVQTNTSAMGRYGLEFNFK